MDFVTIKNLWFVQNDKRFTTFFYNIEYMLFNFISENNVKVYTQEYTIWKRFQYNYTQCYD